MKERLIKTAVRLRFKLTGRRQATNQIRKTSDRYLALAASIDPELGKQSVRVPPMLGVDEDMRDWSFFQILEHNVIVNDSIGTIVKGLAQGQSNVETGVKDPKKDVMPSADPGPEQIEAFRSSVENHLEKVPQLAKLRGTATMPHPIFGPLDAHGWHCMLGLHLEVHLKQAEAVIKELKSRG